VPKIRDIKFEIEIEDSLINGSITSKTAPLNIIIDIMSRSDCFPFNNNSLIYFNYNYPDIIVSMDDCGVAKDLLEEMKLVPCGKKVGRTKGADEDEVIKSIEVLMPTCANLKIAQVTNQTILAVEEFVSIINAIKPNLPRPKGFPMSITFGKLLKTVALVSGRKITPKTIVAVEYNGNVFKFSVASNLV
jgi:hypothetical protein